MKRSVLVFLAIVCMSSTGSTAFAQARPSSASSDVSVGLLELLVPARVVVAQYEWKSGPFNSWAVRAGFTDYSVANYTGFFIGGAYKFYVADSRALTGLAVAPVAGVFIISNSALGQSANTLMLGGEISYKWIFGNFSVEPLAGLHLGFALGSQGVSAYTGPQFAIECMLGYAW